MNKPISSLPPVLPDHFTRPSGLMARTLFITYVFAMTFLPGLVSYMLLRSGLLPWPLLAMLMVACSVISGFGFYLMGHVGHEGFHFTLSKNKWRSALVGTLFSSSIVGFSGVGFYLVHSRHHRHTNSLADPDFQLFSTFKSAWRRLFFMRVKNNRYYMKLLMCLLFKSELPADMVTAFTIPDLSRLGWLNVVAQLFWLSLYGLAFVFDPRLFVCIVLLPHIATAFISAAIVFAQHADTGNSPANNARSHVHPVVTLLMGGTNYHLEHHLYPRVPCWRLCALHNWLILTSWGSKNNLLVERHFWRGFLLVSTRFSYGCKIE